MIFVTVGTHDVGFDRLVEVIDRAVADGAISDEVFVQYGHGRAPSGAMGAIAFLDPEAFQRKIREADVIVSHAGIGVIMAAVGSAKPLVALPRRYALGETYNDHQVQSARALEMERKILVAWNEEDLVAKVAEARTFTPASSEGTCKIVERIRAFIECGDVTR